MGRDVAKQVLRMRRKPGLSVNRFGRHGRPARRASSSHPRSRRMTSEVKVGPVEIFEASLRGKTLDELLNF